MPNQRPAKSVLFKDFPIQRSTLAAERSLRDLSPFVAADSVSGESSLRTNHVLSLEILIYRGLYAFQPHIANFQLSLRHTQHS